jgi:hypothetical protein
MNWQETPEPVLTARELQSDDDDSDDESEASAGIMGYVRKSSESDKIVKPKDVPLSNQPSKGVRIVIEPMSGLALRQKPGL